MKIILSRKGFDSANGSFPSPILPDGTMLSLPIPEDEETLDPKTGYRQTGFSDIFWEEWSYENICWSLSKGKWSAGQFCHLDPDIRPIRRRSFGGDWKPAFGQCSSAETHLRNNEVSVGDLFLFFGWFRQTEQTQNSLYRFIRSSPDVQAIYGYLQIGSILRGAEIPGKYPWHPHASPAHQATPGNTLYIPSETLNVSSVKTGLPGYGVFTFSEDLVLTAPGKSRSKWKLHDWMKTTPITHHSKDSLHEDYFQSAAIGQEFVMDANPENLNWVSSLFHG